MNEEKARKVLGDDIEDDNTLHNIGTYLAWPSCKNKELASLDGVFTADDLEAIAWWMRNKEPKT